VWEIIIQNGQIVWPAIVGIVVILILTGQLITRRQLRDQLASKDKDLAEWRAAWHVERERNDVFAGQIDDTTKIARAAVHALEAIPRGARQAQGRGERANDST
jgi:hypothetical protein